MSRTAASLVKAAIAKTGADDDDKLGQVTGSAAAEPRSTGRVWMVSARADFRQIWVRSAKTGIRQLNRAVV
jgi:hypothetical protein